MTKYEDWTLLTFKIKVFASAIFIVDIKINKSSFKTDHKIKAVPFYSIPIYTAPITEKTF